MTTIRITLLAVALLGCADDDAAHDFTIDPHLRPCIGGGAQLCMVVSEDGGDPRNHFDGFVGFEFHWGIETRLRARTETIADPPADGSSIRFVVEDVIEQIPIADGFALDFPDLAPGNEWFADAGSATSLQMRGTAVECDAAVCAAILDAARAGLAFGVDFELTPVTDVLRATALR